MVVEAEESRDSLREDGDRANSHPGSGTLPARYKPLLFLIKKNSNKYQHCCRIPAEINLILGP